MGWARQGRSWPHAVPLASSLSACRRPKEHCFLMMMMAFVTCSVVCTVHTYCTYIEKRQETMVDSVDSFIHPPNLCTYSSSHPSLKAELVILGGSGRTSELIAMGLYLCPLSLVPRGWMCTSLPAAPSLVPRQAGRGRLAGGCCDDDVERAQDISYRRSVLKPSSAAVSSLAPVVDKCMYMQRLFLAHNARTSTPEPI